MSKLGGLEWPDYNDPQFYTKINENLDMYKIPESLKKKTDEELCNFDPTKFKMQPQQKVGAVYIAPNTPYKRFLIVNKPGSGKTCESIAIAEGFIRHDYHILVSVPRPLMENFYNELTTRCAQSVYLKGEDELDDVVKGSDQHIRIMDAAKIKIKKRYTVETHQTFIKNWHAGVYTSGSNANRKFVIIVDEIHKLISDSSNIYQDYLALTNQLEGTEHRFIGLTGTPQNDRYIQFALLSNLFLPKKLKFDTDTFLKNYILKETIALAEGAGKKENRYSFTNIDDIKYRLKGLVGYYHSLRNKGYPTVKKYLIECEMSIKQTNAFLRQAEIEFKIKDAPPVNKDDERERSVAFYGTRSISSFIPFEDYSDIKEIKEHSIKMLNCLKIMKKAFTNKKLPGYIYDPYIELGVEYIAKVLTFFGYSQITIQDRKVHIPNNNKPKFIVLQGDTKPNLAKWAANVYRSKENIGGKKLAWILGTKTMGLGLNLGGTRTEIIYSLDWNWPNMNQIMDRGYRFCGSAFLPKKDRTIDVFFLEAIPDKKSGFVISSDKYMRKVSDFKKVLSDEAEKIFHEVSIDCNIFSWANRNDEMGIVCYDGSPPETIIDNFIKADSHTKVHKPTPPCVTTIRINSSGIVETSYIKMLAYIRYKIGGGTSENLFAFIMTSNANTKGWVTIIRARLAEDLEFSVDDDDILEFKIDEKVINNSVKVLFIKEAGKPRIIKKGETDVEFEEMGHGELKGSGGGESKAAQGCPKERRVDKDGNCSVKYPYKRKNKQGYECCYAKAEGTGEDGSGPGGRAHIKNNRLYFGRKMCDGYKKNEIISMGIAQNLLPEGAKGTADELCNTIKANVKSNTFYFK